MEQVLFLNIPRFDKSPESTTGPVYWRSVNFKMTFGCLWFSQKTNLKSQFFALAYWGKIFSFVFWENWRKEKWTFEINWPLVGADVRRLRCMILISWFGVTIAPLAPRFRRTCSFSNKAGIRGSVVRRPRGLWKHDLD